MILSLKISSKSPSYQQSTRVATNIPRIGICLLNLATLALLEAIPHRNWNVPRRDHCRPMLQRGIDVGSDVEGAEDDFLAELRFGGDGCLDRDVLDALLAGQGDDDGGVDGIPSGRECRRERLTPPGGRENVVLQNGCFEVNLACKRNHKFRTCRACLTNAYWRHSRIPP